LPFTSQPASKPNQTLNPNHIWQHNRLVVVVYRGFLATTTILKTKLIKQDKRKTTDLFLLLFGVVFAFVDAQLALRLNAAAFSAVPPSQNLGKLKEGTF